MWKVLTGLLAEQLSYYTEKFQLLPDHHFRGHPRQTTTDTMHLLIYRIKDTWCKGKVVSVLFLDIEGAFPNAVVEKLVHNMRKCKVPTKIINFTEKMLANRATRLRFDDYKSNEILIGNGIGQGDPLSMGLYQFYNADLLDIPADTNELTVTFIDDALMGAIANTFKEMHKTLAGMMSRDNSVTAWSKDHNSPLKYSKLALIDFAYQNHHAHQPDLMLPHGMVKLAWSTKYLGFIIDQHLSWTQQHVYVINKGTKWISQIR